MRHPVVESAIIAHIKEQPFKRYQNEHEAYAVILEQIDKLKTGTDFLEESVDSFWRNVKERRDTCHKAENIMEFALDVACLAAEVAQAACVATAPYRRED